MDLNALIEKADEARVFSYSPYSHYAVGAAVLTDDERIFIGANIENAAYPSGMCAERCALFHAYMHGYKKENLKALAIFADGEGLPYPCGACRQVIGELFPLDAPIVIANKKGEKLVSDIRDLLPYIFDESNLKA